MLTFEYFVEKIQELESAIGREIDLDELVSMSRQSETLHPESCPS